MYEYQFLVALYRLREVSEMRCELHELQIESAKHFLIIVLAISSWVSYRLQKIAIRRTLIDKSSSIEYMLNHYVHIESVIIDWSRRSTNSVTCRMPRNDP